MSAGLHMGNVKLISVFQITVDLGSIATNTSGETDVNVPGVKVGDFVFVNKPTLEAGLGIVNVRVKSDGVISIQAMNTTAGAIDEVSETYTVLLVRPETLALGVAE